MSLKEAQADIKARLPALSPANRRRAERIGHSVGLSVISNHRAAFDRARHSRARLMLQVAYNFAEVKFWREWKKDVAAMYAPRRAGVPAAVIRCMPLQLDLFGGTDYGVKS